LPAGHSEVVSQATEFLQGENCYNPLREGSEQRGRFPLHRIEGTHVLAGQIYAPRKIRLIELPEPELPPDVADPLADGEILFQPELACLCGSDLPFFDAQEPEYPCEVGQSLHEMIGRVVATNGVKFQVGDRVLCVPVEHFGLSERFRVSQHRAIPLDPRASDDEALLAQPLGTAIFAMRKMPHVLGLDVAIVGQGPMGQLFAALLRNLGARHIIAIDPIEARLEVSPRMGATVTINPDKEDPVEATRRITGGKLADIVVEAVGHRDQAFNRCVDLCREQGTILQFGVPPTEIHGVPWRKLFWKNISIVTSVGPDFAIDFPLAMQWIAEKRIDVRPIITHRFPFRDIQEAFDTFVDRRDGALKVFLDFRE
jgi:threonine dehydrogenase-like Zn-dependent dehydrogenase